MGFILLPHPNHHHHYPLRCLHSLGRTSQGAKCRAALSRDHAQHHHHRCGRCCRSPHCRRRHSGSGSVGLFAESPSRMSGRKTCQLSLILRSPRSSPHSLHRKAGHASCCDLCLSCSTPHKYRTRCRSCMPGSSIALRLEGFSFHRYCSEIYLLFQNQTISGVCHVRQQERMEKAKKKMKTKMV